MLTGRVVNWKAEQGYGFITPDDCGPDVFLHVAALDGLSPSAVHTGLHVEFHSVRGPKGPKAEQVRVASPRDQSQPQEDQADYLTTEEYGREVEAVLGEASSKLQQLARRHGWVE